MGLTVSKAYNSYNGISNKIWTDKRIKGGQLFTVYDNFNLWIFTAYYLYSHKVHYF